MENEQQQTNEQVEEKQTNFNEFIANELNDVLTKQTEQTETRPSFKFEEENKIYSITVQEKEFGKWTDSESGVIKKIIPVIVEDAEYNWWLNVKNPIYGDVVKGIVAGQRLFKVMRQGSQQNTRYTLVRD